MRDIRKLFHFVFLIIVFAWQASFAGPARSLKVAVIDTGVDFEHEYLRNDLWKNPGEIERNGKDDDNNGFVDDVYGWNFADGTADVGDEDGHGTHISGVIKKFAGEQKSPSFQLMVLKYYDSSQARGQQKQAFLNAIDYAIKMKADVINISAGGPNLNKREMDLLTEASLKGIVIVAAAGNKKPKDRYNAFYPAAYDIPHLISVAAANANGSILLTSNLNEKRANILMDGENIVAALPGNRFGSKTGSSQAAASLTGNLIARFQKSSALSLHEVAAQLSGDTKVLVSESSIKANEI